jgi:hypothetical protein
LKTSPKKSKLIVIVLSFLLLIGVVTAPVLAEDASIVEELNKLA